MKKDLTQRTVDIIVKGGRILLKRKDGWYLGQWTNIAAGPDEAHWARKRAAQEFHNLKWAFVIAPLYGCTVVVAYPKAK